MPSGDPRELTQQLVSTHLRAPAQEAKAAEGQGLPPHPAPCSLQASPCLGELVGKRPLCCVSLVVCLIWGHHHHKIDMVHALGSQSSPRT